MCPLDREGEEDVYIYRGEVSLYMMMMMMTHFAFKKDYHNIYALCVFLSLSFRSLLIFGGL